MGHEERVVVVGTGYVGLPVALMLADAGYPVVGVDIDENVVRAVNDGELHIDEAQLRSLMDDPRVRANLSGSHHVPEADVFIVAVPTPLNDVEKHADLGAVGDALEDIQRVLRPGNVVIIESTIPPLTCRDIAVPILERSGLAAHKDFHIAHCPERILPGDIFREIVENDRIIGSASAEGRARAEAVYRSFVKGSLYLTDDVTAELVKLMENTYRDVNIGLANELAAVAQTLGVDAKEAIGLANLHPRVDILKPGIGVGGHCIPIDPWFINQVDPANSTLVRAARAVNESIPEKIAADVRLQMADIEGPRIVAAGVSYKADTVDTRESPALEVIESLQRDGYQVVVHDPIAYSESDSQTLADVARDADLLIVLVPHAMFRDELRSNRKRIEAGMRTPRIRIFS